MPLHSSKNPGSETVSKLVKLFYANRFSDVIAETNSHLRNFPDSEVLRNLCGAAYTHLGEFEKASDQFKKAIAANPEFADAHNNIGLALKALGHRQEALSHLDRAIELNPTYHTALNNKGVILSELGEFDRAIDCYSQAIECKPDYGEAHRNLSLLKKFTSKDSEFELMSQHLRNSALPDIDRMHFAFAMGKALDDLKDYSAAFRYFQMGNDIQSNLSNYNFRSDEKLFSQIRATSSELDLMAPNADYKDSPTTPFIFVVGMPRSGTTLLEQILASHPEVYGAGETEFINQALSKTGWPSVALDDSGLKFIANYYSAQFSKINIGAATRVVDKNPLNFRWLPLIRAAMPGSRFVHIVRDKRATCWSIYRYYFEAAGNAYSSSLSTIIEYYLAYESLMEFFTEKYSENIFTIHYEELTNNPRQCISETLNFLNLSWNENCLNHQSNRQPVTSASSFQVRQPIYSGSSSQWKNYQSYLEGKFQEF